MPEARAARDLAQTARAVALIFEARLENVEILLSYDNPHYDLVVPRTRFRLPRGSSGTASNARRRPPRGEGRISASSKEADSVVKRLCPVLWLFTCYSPTGRRERRRGRLDRASRRPGKRSLLPPEIQSATGRTPEAGDA
jgi:hypothetical protein